MRIFCRWLGHKWFPDLGRREFLPMQDTCLRCPAVRTVTPWGKCLGGGGHDIADHYRQGDGVTAHPTADCEGPR